MIRLVTRGDDAGSFVSANRAIRECCVHGILRNVSVLATGPELEDAASRLLDIEGVCFGLHACLTAEWDRPRWGPVLPREEVPTILDDEGMLHREVSPLHEGNARLDEMLAELAAQLARLREVGFRVGYMDTHMCFGWLEGMEDGLADLARREGLVYAPPVERLPGAEGDRTADDHASRMLASLGAACELSAGGDGTYLVVGHPAYDDDEMRAVRREGVEPGSIARDRDGQRLMFMRGDVAAFCRERGVVPVRYDEV